MTPETLVPEGTRNRTLLLDTSPRNRASQEPDGRRQEWFPGMERTLSQRRSSCLLFVASKRTSFFQTINVIAAIFLAKVKRAIVGFFLVASKFS